MDALRFIRSLAAAAAVVLPAGTALGQSPVGDGPLKWQLTPVTRARSHAPALFDLALYWDGAELLEGRLELIFQVDGKRAAEYRADDLALATGRHRMRFSIPPLYIPRDESRIVALARFVGQQREYRLEPIEPYLPAFWRRSFVIGVAHPESRIVSDYQSDLLGSLFIERFNPDDSLRVGLTTFPARLPPDDFPNHGLGYCHFDLLLLEGAGFRRLDSSRLEAIADWVEAGGSVCVAPGPVVTESHVQFLNRLAGVDAVEPVYVHDGKGNLLLTRSTSPEAFAAYRTGAGRSVVLHRQLALPDFDSPGWRRAVAFLWKARDDQADRIARRGKWKFQYDPGQDDGFYVFGGAAPFRPMPLSEAARLRRNLIPRSIQGVPFSVVAGILVIFLLVAAPADYFLLGLLGCRRYTWVVFPAVSVAFTLLTVRLARSHMAATDYRQSVVFVDVVDDGRVVRASRFELLMLADERPVRSEFKKSLFTHLDGAALSGGDASWSERVFLTGGMRTRRRRLATDSAGNQESSVPPVYRGRMPFAFTVAEQMRQWSPRLTRLTRLQADVELPKLDWSLLDELNLHRPEDRRRLQDDIRQAVPEARVILLNGQEAETPGFEASAEAQEPTTESFVAELVRAASVRPDSGWFAVVSQIAPTGAGNFEDLALLDPSDRRQWLVIVLVRRGEDWIAIRKLHRNNS